MAFVLTHPILEALTQRNRDIWALQDQGLKGTQIARRLGIDIRTARNLMALRKYAPVEG